MNPKQHIDSSRPAIDFSQRGVAVLQGKAKQPKLPIAIVASRFNAPIVEAMVDGAISYLQSAGVETESIHLIWVPGAWELAQAAQQLAMTEKVSAIIAIGCIIRGDTGHYDVIANESARSLLDVALVTQVPITNAVLTCENQAQAEARAGGSEGNKGAEAAAAALEMADLKFKIEQGAG